MMGNLFGLHIKERNKSPRKLTVLKSPPLTKSSDNKIHLILHLNSIPIITPTSPASPVAIPTTCPLDPVEIPKTPQTVEEALLILENAGIAMSQNLYSALTRNEEYAVDIAIALLYLHKCDIFLTATNLSDIADAKAHVWEVAENVAWFATSIDSNIRIITSLINALSDTENVSDSAKVIAVISCLIPLTDSIIYAIAKAQDAKHFLKTVLSLKNNGIKLTNKDIIALARAEISLREIFAMNIRVASDITHLNSTPAAVIKAEIMKGLMRNSLLPAPEKVNQDIKGAHEADIIPKRKENGTRGRK